MAQMLIPFSRLCLNLAFGKVQQIHWHHAPGLTVLVLYWEKAKENGNYYNGVI